jgi:hypothetical protein
MPQDFVLANVIQTSEFSVFSYRNLRFLTRKFRVGSELWQCEQFLEWRGRCELAWTWNNLNCGGVMPIGNWSEIVQRIHENSQQNDNFWSTVKSQSEVQPLWFRPRKRLQRWEHSFFANNFTLHYPFSHICLLLSNWRQIISKLFFVIFQFRTFKSKNCILFPFFFLFYFVWLLSNLSFV